MPPLSLPIRSHALFYTVTNTALSISLLLFFATHSARVLSVRNIDLSLFLSLSLWFEVIFNKDSANLETLFELLNEYFVIFLAQKKPLKIQSQLLHAQRTHIN